MSRALLAHAPTQAELERLYFEFARIGAPSVGRKSPWPYRPRRPEELIALGGEMLRHDPRLLTILLSLFVERWNEWNPLELRRQMARMQWPQALLVVVEFARLASSDAELRHFLGYLAAGWDRVEPAQLFFFGGAEPGSRMAQRQLGRNLAPYARWGFIGTERPASDVFAKRTVGRYDSRTRRDILESLAERLREFTLADYLEAVDHSITRQQALRDLHSCPEIELSGHGRGARWKRRNYTSSPSQ